MLPDIEKLPNDDSKLKAIISDLYDRNRLLEERLRLFKNELFGRKSEKNIPDGDDPQLRLFDEVEVLVEKEPEETQAVPAHTRTKHKRKPLPEALPRIEVVHDIDEKDKLCDCGHTLDRIGEDSCEKLDIIPAKVRVIRHVRPKYACKNCEGLDTAGPTVKIAPVARPSSPKASPLPDCWPTLSRPSTWTRCRCTGKRRSLPVTTSICPVRPWPNGWSRCRTNANR